MAKVRTWFGTFYCDIETEKMKNWAAAQRQNQAFLALSLFSSQALHYYEHSMKLCSRVVSIIFSLPDAKRTLVR